MSGNSARLEAKRRITDFKLPKGSYSQKQSIKKLFGSNVFDLRVMKKRFSKSTAKAIDLALDSGTPLGAKATNEVASVMKDWALENGVTHFGHIFYPLDRRAHV